MDNWIEHSTGFKYFIVEISLLDDHLKQAFSRRRDSVMMRLNGVPLHEIAEATGISAPEVIRILKRFKTKSPNGVCYGEVALIPRQRIKKYERTKPLEPKRTEQKGGMAGALGMLLKRHPEINVKFIDIVLRYEIPFGKGTKFQKSMLCQDFYKMCSREGVGNDEWPFTQPRAANRTICTFIEEILDGHFRAGALAVGGTTSLIHSNVGRGIEPLLCNLDVLDALEIDSHFLDGIFVLNVKGDRRLTTEDTIDRFWIICARCRHSKAVFAARYVFASEVTALDVFQVICDAFLGNWRPIGKFSFPDLKYIANAGMPSFVFPEIRNHCITAIFFDNAMQHYANDVKELCLEMLGIAIDYGPLNLPSRRSTIEGLFGAIANRVLHSLSSTTGSNPFNGRSENAVGAAVYYNINVDEALEVLDCFIANFNATPMSGANKSNSPLEAIAAYLRSDDLFIPVMSEGLVNIKGIGLMTRKVRVQGNLAKGIRPRIKLDRALYTSRDFSDMSQLIGKYVYVKIDPADFRKVTVYLESGVEVGEIQVELAWRDYKHSVQTRKIINRAHDKKAFRIFEGQSPIVVYRTYLLAERTPANNREVKRLEAESSLGALQTEISPKCLPYETHFPESTAMNESSPKELTHEQHSEKSKQKQPPKWEAMDEFKF